MANVPRLSKILRGKETKPQTELESAIKYAIDHAGGGGDKSPLIVKGIWAEGESAITVDINNSGYTLSDIYAAAQAGRSVFLEYTEDGTTTRMGLATRAESDGEYNFGFTIGAEMSGHPVVGIVEFDNTPVGVFTIAAGQ